MTGDLIGLRTRQSKHGERLDVGHNAAHALDAIDRLPNPRMLVHADETRRFDLQICARSSDALDHFDAKAFHDGKKENEDRDTKGNQQEGSQSDET